MRTTMLALSLSAAALLAACSGEATDTTTTGSVDAPADSDVIVVDPNATEPTPGTTETPVQ